MQLWYMSSFRKADEQGETIAQVKLSHGKKGWFLEWICNKPVGSEREQWYTGNSFDELLLSYRYHISGKQAAGFEPCMECLEQPLVLDRKSMHSQMLYYYAEQKLHENKILFEKLRKWRKEKAMQAQIAPFIVATNRVLGMISVFKPQTLEHLKQLPGIGKTKLEKYGEDWIDIIQETTDETAFPLDKILSSIHMSDFRTWFYQMKEKQYKEQWEDTLTRKKLLKAIQKQVSLDKLESQFGCTRRKLVEWIEQFDQEGYDMTAWIERELNELTNEQLEQVFQCFSEIGDRLLKPVMQQLYGKPDRNQLESIYEKLRFMRILYRKNKQQQVV